MLNNANKNKVLKLLSPNRKLGDVACAYIYADGFLVIKFEKWDNVQERYDTTIKVVNLPGVECYYKGRIVVFRTFGLAHLRSAIAAGLRYVQGGVPSLERGSEKSRKLGIAVGSVTFGTKLGELHHMSVSCISEDFGYTGEQRGMPETWDTFQVGGRWSDYPIVEKIDLAVAQKAAA